MVVGAVITWLRQGRYRTRARRRESEVEKLRAATRSDTPALPKSNA
jgi:hypothetical protein